MSRRAVLVLSLLLLIVSPASWVMAQGGDEACPALVETALDTVNDSCDALARDEACYGHNRVDAMFWEAREDLAFSAPSDRVPVLDVQTIATAPLSLDEELWGLAVLHVQADLPETLPGQAVTFLLMGDVTLENAVSPDEVPEPVTPVEATTTSAVNLRSRPSTNASVTGSVPAGAALNLVGVNDAGDWYEAVREEGGNVWVFGALVAVEDDEALAALPVTYGADVPPRYGPMQAFYLETGFGAPACHETPNALVVRGPEGAEVALSVNDMEVQFGSTVVFTVVDLSAETSALGLMRPAKQNGPMTALVMTLAQGAARALGYNLTQPGHTVAAPLQQGMVPTGAQPIQLPPAVRDQVGMTMTNAVHNAGQTTYFGGLPTGGAFPLTYLGPFNAPPPPPASDQTGHDQELQAGQGAGEQPAGDQGQDQQQPSGPPLEITRPASGTELVGGGAHHVEWQGGTPPYRVDVIGDSANASGFGGLNYNTGGNSVDINLNDMPYRAEGWGYIIRVTDANGQIAEVWVVRRGEVPPPPPSPPTCGNGVVEEGEECDPPGGSCGSDCQYTTSHSY